jgi:hypothetical protein
MGHKMETRSEHKSIPQKSPNYPNMSLEEAISKARVLYDKDGKAGAPKKVGLAHLGYNTLSGPALRTLSTLRKFDLITDKDGRIIPSQRSIDLLVYPKNSERYIAALRGIALKPIVYNKLWNKYQDGFPSDASLKAELIDEYNFNPKQVDRFIADFKKTIEFAGLTIGSGSLSGEDKGDQKLKIGDYVQWESQGIVQFEAKQITGFSDDGTYAFVEGTNTGLPVGELSMANASVKESEKGRSGATFTNVRLNALNTETFILDEGQATLQLPAKLSPESCEDLKAWLELIMKKMKRTSDKKDASKAQDT